MQPNTPNYQNQQPQYQQTIIVVGKQKSAGVAFILAFLFGPLGLLYASVTGGVVMFFAGGLITVVTLGFGYLFVMPVCVIWALIAVNKANSKIPSAAAGNMGYGGPPFQQPPAPRPVDLPVKTDSGFANTDFAGSATRIPEQVFNETKPRELYQQPIAAAPTASADEGLYIVIFDEKVSSLAQLGQVLFDNPARAQQYLADDVQLKTNVNTLTKNDVNKVFRLLKIYKSEADIVNRYLKIVYYLNPSLPYRVGDDTSTNTQELLYKSFADYSYYDKVFADFEAGKIQLWLKESNPADAAKLPNGNDYASFLEFAYGVYAGYPFYLNGILFVNPAELAQEANKDRNLREDIVHDSQNLMIWLNAIAKDSALRAGSDTVFNNVDAAALTLALQTLSAIINGTFVAAKTEATAPPPIVQKEPVPIPETQPWTEPGTQKQKFSFGKITKPIVDLVKGSSGPAILAVAIVVPVILVLAYIIYNTISKKPAMDKARQEALSPVGADKTRQASADLYNKGNDFYQQKDYKNAFDAFTSSDAAVANDKSECMLGNLYYMGLGVAQSDSVALRWYLKSAGQKNPSAMYGVGLIYANGGKEVKKDVFKAYKYLTWVSENAPDANARNLAREKLRLINEQ